MKKIISLLMLFVLATSLLVSCKDVPPHDHAFSGNWQKDSDYHWQVCSVEDCKEQSEKGLHDYDVIVGEGGKLFNQCKVCNYTNEKVNSAGGHEHVFSETYSKSENFHWHECTVEGCFETDKSDAHQYGNPDVSYNDGILTLKYTCVDCEYVKIETQQVDASVDNSVEWNALFEGFELTNFSMNVYFGEKDNPYRTNHCVITESGVYYCIPNANEFYIEKNIDGNFIGYARGQDGFTKLSSNDCEEFFVGATRETVIQVTFAENFEKFTYDEQTGIYTATEKIETLCYTFDGQPYGLLYCIHSEVKVANGKIISIACDYNFDGSDNRYASFIYYNIGMSEMKIPQSVIDQALTNS